MEVWLMLHAKWHLELNVLVEWLVFNFQNGVVRSRSTTFKIFDSALNELVSILDSFRNVCVVDWVNNCNMEPRKPLMRSHTRIPNLYRQLSTTELVFRHTFYCSELTTQISF